MSWEPFYLTCFGLGFTLSALSFLLGAAHLHLPIKGHLPHFWPGHAVGAPHVHGHGAAHLHDGALSPFNLSTVMAFLAWFGGAGYLLTHHSAFVALPVLALAVLTGLSGAALVFWFMARVLWSPQENMIESDYDLVGIVGVINSPIRDGGTGEIIYSLAGTRRTAGARSEDSRAIAKGEEVVITSYQGGIVYVKRWSDLANTNAS
jgi:membrane protein implicated in regulation of membrane protease activity